MNANFWTDHTCSVGYPMPHDTKFIESPQDDYQPSEEQLRIIRESFAKYEAIYRASIHRCVFLAWYFARVFDAPEPALHHYRFALDVLRGDDDAVAREDAALGMLARELAVCVHNLRVHVGMNRQPPGHTYASNDSRGTPIIGYTFPEILEPIDGMMPLDAKAAQFIEKIGNSGKSIAEKIRTKSRERWAKWSEHNDTDTQAREPEAMEWLALRWPHQTSPGDLQPAADPRVDLLHLWMSWSRKDPNGAWDGAVIYEALCNVLWRDVVKPQLEKQRDRLQKVLVPTVHSSVAKVTLMGAAATKVSMSRNGALTLSGEDWSGSLPPSVTVVVAEEALGVDKKSGGRIVGSLVAWLARRVWERWKNSEERFDYIPMPAGRNEMRSIVGADVTEDELDCALEWLKKEHIGGFPAVAGVHTEEKMGERGGRPRKVRVIHVGPALAPMGLTSVFKQAGATVPADLRFYGFVLEPSTAPLVGDRRTHARQRDVYALFLGLYITQKRLEYAERGGVAIAPADWRAALRGMGIYHRSHQSLADDVLAAYTQPRNELWARGPVLVETSAGSGVYRLGPDFSAQEAAILNAAKVSSSSIKAAQRSNRKQKHRIRVG